MDFENQHTAEEREACLKKMREASAAFYRAACASGNHAFVEFTGLLNEYIGICAAAHAEGIDFMMANTHTGTKLPMRPHHVAYLTEKLDCIYGPALAAMGLAIGPVG